MSPLPLLLSRNLEAMISHNHVSLHLRDRLIRDIDPKLLLRFREPGPKLAPCGCSCPGGEETFHCITWEGFVSNLIFKHVHYNFECLKRVRETTPAIFCPLYVPWKYSLDNASHFLQHSKPAETRHKSQKTAGSSQVGVMGRTGNRDALRECIVRTGIARGEGGLVDVVGGHLVILRYSVCQGPKVKIPYDLSDFARWYLFF